MSQRSVIIPIILAAGASRRMGSPKALLRIGGKSFVSHLVDLYRSLECKTIIVVIGAVADEVRRELHGPDIRIVVNEHYRSGQLSSIIAGIKEANECGCSAVVLHPVDHPAAGGETVKSLIARFDTALAPIVLPAYKGRRGHPVIFSSKLFPEIRNAPPDIGARAVVRAHHDTIQEVTTDDEGVLLNVDTPQDYRRLRMKHGLK